MQGVEASTFENGKVYLQVKNFLKLINTFKDKNNMFTFIRIKNLFNQLKNFSNMQSNLKIYRSTKYNIVKILIIFIPEPQRRWATN